jgi:hypothetical protein
MVPDLFKNIVEKYNMEIISQENFQVFEKYNRCFEHFL